MEGNVKRVQHREGGIVKEILAEDGDVVAIGQMLMRLDDTTTASNLEVIKRGVSEAYALEACLLAEIAGEAELPISQVPEAVRLEPEFENLLLTQQQLLVARETVRAARISQLDEQIVQLERQIEGLEIQEQAVASQLQVAKGERDDLEPLFERGLVQAARFNTMFREVASLEGERARVLSEIAEARALIAERRIQISQISYDFQAELLDNLQAVRQAIAETRQRQIAGEDRLRRLEVRTPQWGIEYESAFHTLGGVVAAGETLMLIVPKEDRLVVRSRIKPVDIDSVAPAQSVTVRLPSFDQRLTPQLEGRIERLAPDLSRDPSSGEAYYLATVEILPNELDRLAPGQRLVPGMPAESFIQTGVRSVLSYLLKPLTEQIEHALREQ